MRYSNVVISDNACQHAAIPDTSRLHSAGNHSWTPHDSMITVIWAPACDAWGGHKEAGLPCGTATPVADVRPLADALPERQ